MNHLIRCTQCLLPETHETITFDQAGVCSVCINSDLKDSIDWQLRKDELFKLAAKFKGQGSYDCIVPFSGGKDSVWTLYYVVNELKLKPLVVSFDHGFFRPNLIENRNNVLKRLGVDSIIFTPNWKLVRALMLQSFLEKGDFCWHCHTGIFSYPMWIAIEKKIPLVLWGEPSSEYTSYYDYSEIETVDIDRFNTVTNLGMSSEDILNRLGEEFTERDLLPFTYPPISDLAQLGVMSVPLGSFIPWDVKRQVELIEQELDWKGDFVEGVPPGYGYEKIECYMQGVRDYIKFIKRGYARTTHLTSIDIRNGRISREEAMKLVQEYEGQRPHALDLFLDYTGLTEVEFMEIALSHKLMDESSAISISIGKKPDDFEVWQKWPGLPKNKKDEMLNSWKQNY
jgi:N-acetyl sugar amidotransferase